jgi:hypothetical protein
MWVKEWPPIREWFVPPIKMVMTGGLSEVTLLRSASPKCHSAREWKCFSIHQAIIGVLWRYTEWQRSRWISNEFPMNEIKLWTPNLSLRDIKRFSRNSPEWCLSNYQYDLKKRERHHSQHQGSSWRSPRVHLCTARWGWSLRRSTWVLIVNLKIMTGDDQHPWYLRNICEAFNIHGYQLQTLTYYSYCNWLLIGMQGFDPYESRRAPWGFHCSWNGLSTWMKIMTICVGWRVQYQSHQRGRETWGNISNIPMIFPFYPYL